MVGVGEGGGVGVGEGRGGSSGGRWGVGLAMGCRRWE